MIFDRSWRPLRRLALVPIVLAVPWTAHAQLMEDPTIPAERSTSPRFEVPNPGTGDPALDAVMNFEFERAAELFDQIEARDPRSPEAEFGRGLMEWWRLVSGSKGGDPDRVEKHLDRARDLSRDFGDRPGKRAEALYFSGRASSLLSALHLIKGSMMGAYRASQQTKSYLSKCLEEDPSLVDANLGLGLYHYYADALPKYLKLLGWVFGVKGDRELGLQELRAAASRGDRATPEALYFLANVYSNFEGEPDKGLDAIRWLVQRYPNNHVFFLEYMSALESLGYYAEAETLMRNALAEEGHFSDVRAVKLMLGRNYYRQALYSEGAAVLEEALRDPDLSDNDPVVPWFSYFAGRCRDLMGDWKAAEAHYRRAEKFEIGGNVAQLAEDRRKDRESEEDRRLRRARGHLRRGELAEGIEAWESIVADLAADRFETSLSLGQLRYRLALTYEEAGKYEEAKRQYALVDDEDYVKRAQLGSARCDFRAGTLSATEALERLAASESDVAGKARALVKRLSHGKSCTMTAEDADSTIARHYREPEAWTVDIVFRSEDGGESKCLPMRFVDGVWRARVPLADARRAYYYRVDHSRVQPDPLTPWITEKGAPTWSVANVPDPFAEQAGWSELSMQ